jgi:hypothetical protein
MSARPLPTITAACDLLEHPTLDGGTPSPHSVPTCGCRRVSRLCADAPRRPLPRTGQHETLPQLLAAVSETGSVEGNSAEHARRHTPRRVLAGDLLRLRATVSLLPGLSRRPCASTGPGSSPSANTSSHPTCSRPSSSPFCATWGVAQSSWDSCPARARVGLPPCSSASTSTWAPSDS